MPTIQIRFWPQLDARARTQPLVAGGICQMLTATAAASCKQNGTLPLIATHTNKLTTKVKDINTSTTQAHWT